MKISGKTHVIVPTAVSPPVEVAHPEDSRQVQTKRLGFMAGEVTNPENPGKPRQHWAHDQQASLLVAAEPQKI